MIEFRALGTVSIPIAYARKRVLEFLTAITIMYIAAIELVIAIYVNVNFSHINVPMIGLYIIIISICI